MLLCPHITSEQNLNRICNLCHNILLPGQHNSDKAVGSLGQVWDLQEGKCVKTLLGHSRPVQRLTVAGGFLYRCVHALFPH